MFIQGKSTRCDVTRIAVPGKFDFWGDNIRADAYTTSSVPGYLARLDLSTTLDGKQYAFALRLTKLWVAEKNTSVRSSPDRRINGEAFDGTVLDNPE